MYFLRNSVNHYFLKYTQNYKLNCSIQSKIIETYIYDMDVFVNKKYKLFSISIQ